MRIGRAERLDAATDRAVRRDRHLLARPSVSIFGTAIRHLSPGSQVPFPRKKRAGGRLLPGTFYPGSIGFYAGSLPLAVVARK